MTTTNDMSLLYIPDFVFPSDIDLIKKRFQEEGYGIVSDVELVKQWECELNVDKDDLYSAAFVTVSEWFDNEKSEYFKSLIQDKNIEARLSHGEEDYWEFEVANLENTVNKSQNKDTEQSECCDNHVDSYNHFESLDDRILNLEKHIFDLKYSSNVMDYLLNESRLKYIKKERKQKLEKINKERRKAQRMWKNRLRPLDKLKNVKSNN